MNTIKEHSEYVKEELTKLQHGLCFWCGEKMLDKVLKEESGELYPLSPTIDHVVAKAAGGGGIKKDNIRVACHACNTLRGTYNTALVSTLNTKITNQKNEINKAKEINADLRRRVESLELQRERLADKLLTYLDQPWWRKLYIQIKRFAEGESLPATERCGGNL
jgi:hypothetical protein